MKQKHKQEINKSNRIKAQKDQLDQFKVKIINFTFHFTSLLKIFNKKIVTLETELSGWRNFFR